MKKLLLRKKTNIITPALTKKDVEINVLGTYIQQKLSLGITFSEISIPEKTNLIRFIEYILKKAVRNQQELTCLKYYLSSFPKLKKSLDAKGSLFDSSEVMNKVSMFLQWEEFNRNEIVFLNGEQGDKFYIIFQGEVSVLVPSELEIKLTIEEYLDYLERLIRYKEYDLFHIVINNNRATYMSKEITSMSLIAMNDSQVLRETLSSIDLYIKRIEPVKLSHELLGYPFKLMKYHNILQLGEGVTFGDIALGGENKRRTATIIASERSYIGSLNKEIYQSSIREVIEKLRKANIDLIVSNRLFRGVNHDVFDRCYFNFFKQMTFTHLQAIFTQEDARKEVYFLKSGEIEITLNSSLNDLDVIIEDLGGFPSTRMKSMVDAIPKMVRFCKQRKLFRVYDIGDRDVIGLEDYAIAKTNQFFCTARVKSDKCEVFALEVPFYEKIVKSDKKLLSNYTKHIAVRRKLMRERLHKIKETTILTHFKSYHADPGIVFHSPVKVSTPRLIGITTNLTSRNGFGGQALTTREPIPLLTTENAAIENVFTARTKTMRRRNDVINKEKDTGLTRNERTFDSFKTVPLGRHLKKKVKLFNAVVNKLIEKKPIRMSPKLKRNNNRLNLVDCLVLDRFIEQITTEDNEPEPPVKPHYFLTMSNDTNVTLSQSNIKSSQKPKKAPRLIFSKEFQTKSQ